MTEYIAPFIIIAITFILVGIYLFLIKFSGYGDQHEETICTKWDNIRLNGVDISNQYVGEWFINTERYYYRIYYCPFCGARLDKKGCPNSTKRR